ncbi:hypothetical protein ACIOWG_02580 [Streptomyces sp. NPDC087658]|uniref:hypothetical protein n=1 Tax=Streptomyces sp. NPDC087658 TaxID=3365800 RepID=UPI0037F4F88F
MVRDGARLLVAQSSTSSFQGSWAPERHVSLAAPRAAETGRPMVHAALTGVSTVFGPAGERVGGPIGTGRSAAAVLDVPPAGGTIPYVRFGDRAVGCALAVLAALLTARGVRLLRRALRRRPGPAPPVPPARTARASAGHPGR